MRKSVLVFVLLMVAVAFAPVQVVGAREGTWTHSQGTLSYAAAEAPDRSVEVWYTPDGRYLAKVRSLDGSLAGEDVLFDGNGQTVVITDPEGNQSVVRTDHGEHFAIQVDAQGRLADKVTRTANGTVTMSLDLTQTQIAPDSGLLVLPLPEKRSLVFAEEHVSKPTLSSHTGSNWATFISVVDFQQCVYGYNYRNTTTDYFRGSSSKRGDCLYMNVSLWEGTSAYWPATCGGFWLAVGVTTSGYESKSTYNGVNGTNRCSNHAGWHPDWAMGVAWKGLNAATNS